MASLRHMKNAVRMNRNLTGKRRGTFDPNVDRVEGVHVSIASDIDIRVLNDGIDRCVMVNGNSFTLRKVPKTVFAGEKTVMERQSNR